jgi:hypothetical protein
MSPSIVPVYFPFTFLAPQQGTELSVWFTKIALYQPSEADLPHAMDTPENRHLIDVRIPLKDDHDQFLATCNAYRNWGQDSPELKNRSGDALPFADEDRPRAIRDAVRRQAAPAAQAKSAISSQLTTRVFLQLAQDFDGSQWETIGGLTTVDRMEKNMFSRMLGENTESIQPAMERPSFSTKDRGDKLTAERLSAWTTLLLKDIVDNVFFITDSTAVIDYIADKTPSMALVGAFPAFSGEKTAAETNAGDDLCRAVKALAQASEPLTTGDETPGSLKTVSSGVQLYVVPGKPPRNFFPELSGRNQAAAPVPTDTASDIRNTVIGHLLV